MYKATMKITCAHQNNLFEEFHGPFSRQIFAIYRQPLFDHEKVTKKIKLAFKIKV